MYTWPCGVYEQSIPKEINVRLSITKGEQKSLLVCKKRKLVKGFTTGDFPISAEK